MDHAIDVFRYITAVGALALAIVAALQARRSGGPARWGAGAFAALAAVLLVGLADENLSTGWASKLLICVLLLFPYLLLRFAASFGLVSSRATGLANAGTAVILLATVALPSLPGDGDPQPAWTVVYIAAVAGLWVAASLVTIVGLLRGGVGQPAPTRRRAQLMSAGTAGMAVLILLAAAGVSNGAGELAVEVLLLASLASFSIGFVPPTFVRLMWRGPEQEALRHAMEQLLRARTVEDITDALLPHVSRIVGGSGAALCGEDGKVVASFGDVQSLQVGAVAADDAGHEVVPLSPPFGALVVATGPLTPFFGHEEIGLLHGIAVMVDLSLARCEMSRREAENQEALRVAMQETERANTAKSDFLSRMSHELRTPLNVILGFGQILEMRGSLDEQDSEAVKYMLKGGQHLLELINEVLDLSRIESGRMAISPEPVDVADLASDALELIRPLADERSIRLATDLGAGHRHVIADRQRLKQVLLNLLANAVKYNREGGSVAVSCTEADGTLRLCVEDTGLGVPPALVEKLFQPFERLGAERSQVEGTGLGLALSRQLVELMGGQIGVESREGEGSRFWIELAIAETPRETHAPAVLDGAGNGGRPASEGRRVLLVEDNLANLKVIQSVMSGHSEVELLPAMTGRLGIELAREHQPDLILLDQHLPDVTGAEVLHRLKADRETRAIPVVMVSADATPGQARRMLELGADEYMTKPLDVPKFLAILDGILAAVEPVA